jgi:hypothetical protein
VPKQAAILSPKWESNPVAVKAKQKLEAAVARLFAHLAPKIAQEIATVYAKATTD